MYSRLFCGSLRSGCLCAFVLLVGDCLERDRKTLKRRKDAVERFGDKVFLRGNFGKRDNVLNGNNFAFDKAAFYGDLVAVIFCEFADNLCGSNNVVACKSKRSRSVKNFVKSLVTCFFKSESGQGVLYNSVFNACRTKSLSEFGIFRNRKTFLVNENACAGSLDLFGKSRNDSLLFA